MGVAGMILKSFARSFPRSRRLAPVSLGSSQHTWEPENGVPFHNPTSWLSGKSPNEMSVFAGISSGDSFELPCVMTKAKRIEEDPAAELDFEVTLLISQPVVDKISPVVSSKG